MSFSSMTLSATFVVLISTVIGHGYVENVTVADVTYSGYLPYSDPYYVPVPDRIIRPVQGNGPIDDLNLIDLQCGGYSAGGVVGTTPAALHAGPIRAGSKVKLHWTLWPDSHKGPVITYMAKCPGTDCSTYLPGTDAVWFKIAEEGRDGTSDTWGSTALMTAPSEYSYTIPSCLVEGYYIVRHEIIALHTAGEYPGAQSFPSCHQLMVTSAGGTSTGPTEVVTLGSGTTTAVKVAFPGAYNASDPGITYDITKAMTYTIPGPVLFTCTGDTSSSSDSSPSVTTEDFAVVPIVTASAAEPSTAVPSAPTRNVAANALMITMSRGAPHTTNAVSTTFSSARQSATTYHIPPAPTASFANESTKSMPSGTTIRTLIAWLSAMISSGETTTVTS